jgi:hypothetical protein
MPWVYYTPFRGPAKVRRGPRRRSRPGRLRRARNYAARLPAAGSRQTDVPPAAGSRPCSLFEARDGLGLVVVNVKDRVKLGDLQKVVDLLGQIQEL